MKSQIYFIGALIEDPESVWRISDMVRPEYLSGNPKKLYEAILNNPEHDIRSLSLEAGVDAINYYPDTYLNLEEWAEAVLYDYIERSFQPVIQTLQNDNKHPQDRLDEAREVFDELSGVTSVGGSKSLETLLNEAREELRSAKDHKGLTGITTGYGKVDEKLHGWNSTRLYVIAGRPGTGKTALALNSILQARARTLFFSLEMGGDEIAKRLAIMLTEQSHDAYQGGRADWDKLDAAVEELKQEPLTIIDDVHTIDKIEAVAKHRSMTEGIDIVMVDYLQLIGGTKGVPREQQVSDISRRLKRLAMDLGIPVIALCQLSRKCEERSDKMPILSDLRESGAIEQDADVVMFTHIPANYGIDPPPDAEGDYCLAIGKNRHGATGYIWLNSDLQYYRIRETAKEPTNAPF